MEQSPVEIHNNFNNKFNRCSNGEPQQDIPEATFHSKDGIKIQKFTEVFSKLPDGL